VKQIDKIYGKMRNLLFHAELRELSRQSLGAAAELKIALELHKEFAKLAAEIDEILIRKIKEIPEEVKQNDRTPIKNS